jgi:hypothetical protein
VTIHILILPFLDHRLGHEGRPSVRAGDGLDHGQSASVSSGFALQHITVMLPLCVGEVSIASPNRTSTPSGDSARPVNPV